MNGPPGSGVRVDETGLAFAGSMLQAQLYVNERSDELNRAIDHVPLFEPGEPAADALAELAARGLHRGLVVENGQMVAASTTSGGATGSTASSTSTTKRQHDPRSE